MPSNLVLPPETPEQLERRLKRRKELIHQVNEEIRFACAGQGLTLSAASRLMGDPKGRSLSNNNTGVSLARLADIGAAIGVTFRLVAIPDRDMNSSGTVRPAHNRRLTADQVREIRRRAEAGESHRSLAPEFGVVSSVISNIVSRRAYRDVE